MGLRPKPRLGNAPSLPLGGLIVMPLSSKYAHLILCLNVDNLLSFKYRHGMII